MNKITKSIEEHAAEIWGIPVELLSQKTKEWIVVEPRDVLINYRCDVLGIKPAEAAKKYGLSRPSAYHARKAINSLLFSNKEFKKKYDQFYSEVTKYTI